MTVTRFDMRRLLEGLVFASRICESGVDAFRCQVAREGHERR